MNKKCFGFCAAVLACTGIVAQEQEGAATTLQLDEVVVSDSRFQLKRENSGKTVIKIPEEELQRNQGKTIAEIINAKSGIEIVGSRGREGAIYGVFARGGRGRQVLVIIDGVRVSDPSSSSQEYDLRFLSTASVESIEIIKGAASTLYGTNAATAVINITTKKASKESVAVNIQSSLGTNQTKDDQNYNLSDFANSVRLHGTLDRFSYAAGFSNRYSNGLSAIITPDNEEDDYSNYSADIRLKYQFTPAFSISVYGNQTKLRTQFDESFGMVDAPYQFLSEQKRAGVSSSYTYKNGGVYINGAYTTYDSENVSAFPNTFTGNNLIVDVYNKYTFNEKLHTIVGVNYIDDKGEFNSTENYTLVDPYLNVVYVSPHGLNLNVGGRLNNHSEYGTHFVYNINPSYSHKLKEGYLKVLGSYATSYITPSLTQLFGAFGPNPNLEPEENRTIEGGLEYAMNNDFRASALYFNRKEENFVFFDNGAFQYNNAQNTIDAQGMEVEVKWDLSDAVLLTANYTFTERKGDSAIRIPKHKANGTLGYQFSEKTYASLAYSYTGNRSDTDFSTFTDVGLSPFSLLDAYVGHEVIPGKLKAFLFAGNLLNEGYTEIIGFTTKGRTIRIGVHLNL